MHWLVWVGLGVAVVLLVGVLLWLRARRRSQGPLSIVMLRDRPRTLSEAEVRQAYRLSVNQDAEVHRIEVDEHTTGFGVSGKEGGPPVYVICSHRTYVDDPNDVAGGAEHQDVRRAIREHKAWISVDGVGLEGVRDAEVIGGAFILLSRIASHFLDDGTTLLYQPASGRIGLASPQVGALLAAGDYAQVFAADEPNTPIVRAEPGDKRIAAAMDEAQRRLPEFIDAIKRLGEAGKPLVKIRFESSVDGQTGNEYIWCTVVRASPTTFTVTIENPPLDPTLGQKGDKITVTHDRVVDWAFVDGKKVHGMFVERLLTPGRF